MISSPSLEAGSAHAPPAAEGARESWMASPSQIDIGAVRGALFRNRWIVLSICLAGLLAGLAATLLTVPVYRAQASLQIDQQASRVIDAPGIEPVEAIQDADRFLQTQLEMLRSRALAIRVGERLQLFAGNGFLNEMHVSPDTASIKALGEHDAHREQVISLLQKNLEVALPQGSRIAQVSFSSPHPRLSARIANAFADNMISSNIGRRYDASSYARNFLKDQLAESRDRLESSERAMNSYAQSVGIVDASAASQDGQRVDPGSLTAASLIQANDALSGAVARRGDAEQLWRSVQNAKLASLPDVLANPAVQALMQRRAELDAQFASQSQGRQAQHPDIIRARSEMSALEARLGTLEANIRESVHNRYRAALLQEQQMLDTVNRLKQAVVREQDRSIRYNILRREVNTNRELYDGLLQRFKEVSAASGVTANNISIVDYAPVPVSPASPNLLVNLGLALLGGFVLAIGVTYLRETFDDIVRTPEEVESKLGLSLLGIVPMIARGGRVGDEMDNPHSRYAEAFHAVRSAIELSRPGGVPRSILFSSCRKGEGKTSSAYSVARDFAGVGGRRVLIVDGDLRRPMVHKLFGLSNESGFSQVLAGQREAKDLIRASGLPGLDVLTAGPISPNPADLLGSPHLPAIIADLTRSYDLVLFDGAPVLGLADAPSLAAHIEAIVYVLDPKIARHGMVKAALRRLRMSQGNILGVLLNRVDVTTLGYSYDRYFDYYADKDDRPAKRWLGR